jgi:hypothetical protein
MDKNPGGQLHLIGKYLYVLAIPRKKIKEYEVIIQELNVSKVEIRRTINHYSNMNIITGYVK